MDVDTWTVNSPRNTSTTHYTSSTYGKGFKGTQVTVSEGHPWPPRPGEFKGDVGGNFYTKSNSVSITPKVVTEGGPVKVVTYSSPGVPYSFRETKMSGSIYCMYPPSYGDAPFPTADSSTNAELDVAGARAVARCKPTNPVSDLSVFLGELYKEGLPSLVGAQTWKNRTSRAHQAGSEYLNVEFGWLPLVREIRSLADAMNRADAVLAQYERDSGRIVRRKYEFPTEESTERRVMKTGQIPYGFFHSDLGPSVALGELVRYRTSYRKRWFSGAFTYHLPYGYDSRIAMHRNALKAKQVFGATLDPEVLWNLTPWSWAVDWFVNAGDVISNITDVVTDGLVMRYGYIMEHTRVSDTYVLEGPDYQSGPYQTSPMTFTTEVKVRRRANPFGFGLLWSGLSPRQLAIAAALGLTRW